MIQLVPLEAVANQSLSIQLEDEFRYDFRLRDTGSVMAVDVSVNDTVILLGQRATAGTPVIPYKYLEKGGGNFLFLTELNEIPYWKSFGLTQYLLYLSVNELEVIRGN